MADPTYPDFNEGAEAISAHPSFVDGPFCLADDEVASMLDDLQGSSLLPTDEATVSDGLRSNTAGFGVIAAALNATSNLQDA